MMRFLIVIVLALGACVPGYEEPELRPTSLDPTTDMTCDAVLALANQEIARHGEFRWTRFCRSDNGDVVAIRRYETFKGTMSDYIDDVTALFAGNTALRDDPVRGLEVNYYAPNGVTYHWRAKQFTIKRTKWRIDGIFFCRTLPRSALSQGEEEWECIEAEGEIGYLRAMRKGDIFNLELGTAPYQLKEDEVPEGFYER